MILPLTIIALFVSLTSMGFVISFCLSLRFGNWKCDQIGHNFQPRYSDSFNFALFDKAVDEGVIDDVEDALRMARAVMTKVYQGDVCKVCGTRAPLKSDS